MRSLTALVLISKGKHALTTTQTECVELCFCLSNAIQAVNFKFGAKLIKVPARSGITEMADSYAKDFSHKIFKGDIAAPMTITINDTYRISEDIAKRS